jgi:hypothetical protein
MADDLLQMFQSITTHDHDELVDQFAHLLQLDVHTATFFLESCNWNVETAVNNYLVTMEATGGPSVNPMEGMDTTDDLDMEDEGARPPQQAQQPNSASYQAQFISDLSASQNTLFAPDTPVHMVRIVELVGCACDQVADCFDGAFVAMELREHRQRGVAH